MMNFSKEREGGYGNTGGKVVCSAGLGKSKEALRDSRTQSLPEAVGRTD